MLRNISIGIFLMAMAACGHPYTQGRNLYNAYCVNCHIEDGTGLAALIPPLDGSDYLKNNRGSVPCLIRYGSMGGLEVSGTTYTEPMPSFKNLNEVELSNLINYLNTAWGNDLPETSPAEVLKALAECPQATVR